MILVSHAERAEQAFPGQAHERADRGPRRRSGRRPVRSPRRRRQGSVPTVFFHHSRAGHAARVEAAVDVDWLGWLLAVNPDGPTGRSHPHPALLRHVPARPRALRQGAPCADTSGSGQEDDEHERGQDQHQGSRTASAKASGPTSRFSIPARVIDRATFENPHQFPVGIDYVIVNGVLTLEHERHTGALAGRVIYGPGRSKAGGFAMKFLRFALVVGLVAIPPTSQSGCPLDRRRTIS